MSDYEAHLEICDVLREINEDDHDLVSGRFFPEFEYPGMSMEEAQINMTNWDTLLYSREFSAIDDERSMRQVTRLLTYPITVGSVLHELSPYSIGKTGRLTGEGLRSLSGMSKHAHQPFAITNSVQPSATPSTHPAQAQTSTLKACVPTHLPSASSSSAPVPNPHSHAKSGSNSPTSSLASPSTLSSSDRNRCQTATPNSLFPNEHPRIPSVL